MFVSALETPSFTKINHIKSYIIQVKVYLLMIFNFSHISSLLLGLLMILQKLS